MDGKVGPADGAIAAVAARQHGMVSTSQLRRLGISEDATRARRLAGRLHRVHRGVYAVGHLPRSPEARCVAAVLAVGGGPTMEGHRVLEYWKAAGSHASAAFLWGLLSQYPDVIHVVAKRSGRRQQRRGIQVHRPRRLQPAEVTLRHGIPVTTPARTIADLRRVVPEHVLRRAIRQAEVSGLPLGPEEGDRTRSDLEGDFLDLCHRRSLPAPEVNVRVGRDLVDFLWRDAQMVVETDSYLYHRGQVAFQEDRARDLRLKRLGYEVLRISERQLNEERELVAETVAAAIRERTPREPGA